jgi:3-oxoacyl-[acyl-carrier-protein] synthase II
VDGERIWVTGVGLVTALGDDVDRTWPRLVSGERGQKPLTLFEGASQRSTLVAASRLSVADAPAESSNGPWSRTSVFAWKAAAEALTGARMSPRPPRLGLVVGSTTGGMFETESLLAALHEDPDQRDALAKMTSQPLTATAEALSATLGPFSRVRTVCSACSSGANAFIVGALWLLSGEVDAALVGGADALCRLTLTGFNALSATDPDPCLPFDRRRKGLNLGEGAGFAVLERQASAETRGARAIAELSGWALGAEAHHITNPDPSGAPAARVVEAALRRAGLAPSAIDYVNAHGTATLLNDSMEAAALSRALGPDIERIAVSSSKGQLGHTLGAAGAVEAVLSALAVRQQVLLPTAGLDEPDPLFRLVHVPHEGRRARVRAALSNSFGFGGMDTVLVLSEPEYAPPFQRRRHGVVVTAAAALSPAGLFDADSVSRLLDEAPAQDATASPLRVSRDLSPYLDTARARRLDRPARLSTVVASRALATARGDRGLLPTDNVGILLGTAFGSLDASAAFMHRLYEKGPRLASPADFPNLVPSSPVGHVSIYLGLTGPVVTTADLRASGESAVALAIELVQAGEADVLLAGAVEEASLLVGKVRAAILASHHTEGATRLARPRGEGAAVVALESAEGAAARGARVLARVEALYAWTDQAREPFAPPRDASRAQVVTASDTATVSRLVAASAWETAGLRPLDASVGDHEAVGAIAIAAAVGLIHADLARDVLVIGVDAGHGYAIHLTSPAHRAPV